MELSKDLRTACSGYGEPGAAQAAVIAIPDWCGLRARLSSAHALRREMARGASAPVAGGSFSDWPFTGRDEPGRKRAVNLKDSTDRKGPWAMWADNAARNRVGGREQ